MPHAIALRHTSWSGDFKAEIKIATSSFHAGRTLSKAASAVRAREGDRHRTGDELLRQRIIADLMGRAKSGELPATPVQLSDVIESVPLHNSTCRGQGLSAPERALQAPPIAHPGNSAGPAADPK
jgi:hypothetical protein